MRVGNSIDLGLYVRGRRRQLRLTQASLADAARVSRRWVSDLEAGKATVEVGLLFRVLHALDVLMDIQPVERSPDDVDLDEFLGQIAGRPGGDQSG